jgi:predicted tellurium resistance membrane protein TerC
VEILSDPQTWISFLTLSLLEIVLGIDNIIFLVVLVDRLPPNQRRAGRILGLGFAMLTRIALLFCIVWLATLHDTLFTVANNDISGRDLILFGGGLFLVVNSIIEIRALLKGNAHQRKVGAMQSLWLIIVQIGLIDIVFSLDSVFTAIGLAQHIEVMIAAIVLSVIIMMLVSNAVGRFVGRYPTLKVLALMFLILVGAALIAESLDLEIPKGYLYFAMAFAAVAEWINIHVRRRSDP